MALRLAGGLVLHAYTGWWTLDQPLHFAIPFAFPYQLVLPPAHSIACSVVLTAVILLQET